MSDTDDLVTKVEDTLPPIENQKGLEDIAMPEEISKKESRPLGSFGQPKNKDKEDINLDSQTQNKEAQTIEEPVDKENKTESNITLDQQHKLKEETTIPESSAVQKSDININVDGDKERKQQEEIDTPITTNKKIEERIPDTESVKKTEVDTQLPYNPEVKTESAIEEQQHLSKTEVDTQLPYNPEVKTESTIEEQQHEFREDVETVLSSDHPVKDEPDIPTRNIETPKVDERINVVDPGLKKIEVGLRKGNSPYNINTAKHKGKDYNYGTIKQNTRNNRKEIDVDPKDPELKKLESEVLLNKEEIKKENYDIDIYDPELEKIEVETFDEGDRKEKTEEEAFEEGDRIDKSEEETFDDGDRIDKTEVETFDDGTRKEKTEIESFDDGTRKEKTEIESFDEGTREFKTRYSYDEVLQEIFLGFANSLKEEIDETGGTVREQYAFKAPQATNTKRTIYDENGNLVSPNVELNGRSGKRMDPNSGLDSGAFSTNITSDDNNPPTTIDGELNEPENQYINAETSVDKKTNADNSKVFTKYDIQSKTTSLKTSRTDENYDIQGATPTVQRGNEKASDSDFDVSPGYEPTLAMGLFDPFSGAISSQFIRENNLEWMVNSSLNLSGSNDGFFTGLLNKVPAPFGNAKLDSDFQSHFDQFKRKELNVNVLRYTYSSIQSGQIYSEGFSLEGGLGGMLSGLGSVANSAGTALGNVMTNALNNTPAGFGLQKNQLEAAERGFIHGKMNKRIDLSAGHLFNTPYQSFSDYLASLRTYMVKLIDSVDTRINTIVSNTAEKRILDTRRQQDENFSRNQISEEELAEQKDKIKKEYSKQIESFRNDHDPITRMYIQMLPPTEYQAFQKSLDKDRKSNDQYYDIDIDRNSVVPETDNLTWRKFQGTERPDKFADFHKDTWFQAREVDQSNPAGMEWAGNRGRSIRYFLVKDDYEKLGLENYEQYVNDYFTHYFLIFNDGRQYVDKFSSLSFSNDVEGFQDSFENAETKIPRDKLSNTKINDSDTNIMAEVYDHPRDNQTKTLYINENNYDQENPENNTFEEQPSHTDPHISVIDIQQTNQPDIKKKFYDKVKENYPDQTYSYYGDIDNPNIFTPEFFFDENNKKYISTLKQSPETEALHNQTKGDDGNNRIFSSNDNNVIYDGQDSGEISTDPHRREPISTTRRYGPKDVFFKSLYDENNKKNKTLPFSFTRPDGLEGTDYDDNIMIPKPPIDGEESYYTDRNRFINNEEYNISKPNDELKAIEEMAFDSTRSDNPGINVQHGNQVVKHPDIKKAYLNNQEDGTDFFNTGEESNGLQKLTDGLSSNYEARVPLDGDFSEEEFVNPEVNITDSETQEDVFTNVTEARSTTNTGEEIIRGKRHTLVGGHDQNYIRTDEQSHEHIDEITTTIFEKRFDKDNPIYADQLTSKVKNGFEQKILELGYLSVMPSPGSNISTGAFYKIPFQFNPEVTGETRNANWTSINAFGRSNEFFIWANSGSRNIQFKTTYAIIDGEDRSNGNDKENEVNKLFTWGEGWDEKYILRILNKYKGLVEPRSAGAGYSPPIVSIVFGTGEQTTKTTGVNYSRWIATDYNIDSRPEAGFTNNRVYRMWDISMNLREVISSWSDYQDMATRNRNENELIERIEL